MASRCNNAFVPNETKHSDGEISISCDIKLRNNVLASLVLFHFRIAVLVYGALSPN